MHLSSGFGDETDTGLRVGCVDLLRQIRTRVKPQYHVFGHIHESYGCYTDGQTRFINASTCTLDRLPINPPVVFDVAIPSVQSISAAGPGTSISASASASTEAKSASPTSPSPSPSLSVPASTASCSASAARSPGSATAAAASSSAQQQSAASSNGSNDAAPLEVV